MGQELPAVQFLNNFGWFSWLYCTRFICRRQPDLFHALPNPGASAESCAEVAFCSASARNHQRMQAPLAWRQTNGGTKQGTNKALRFLHPNNAVLVLPPRTNLTAVQRTGDVQTILETGSKPWLLHETTTNVPLSRMTLSINQQDLQCGDNI